MTEIEKQLPVLENGFDKWRNAEIEYLGRQVVHIGNEQFNRLSDADWAQIKATQQAYIDQKTEAFFQELKTEYDTKPKQFHESTLNTVLWILSNEGVEPDEKTLWLPYATFANVQQKRAYDKTFGTNIPDITSIRHCYLHKERLGVDWVEPQYVKNEMVVAQIAMLGYVRFWHYLKEKAAPPAEAVAVVQGKLTHPQIALFYIYTEQVITKNNAQSIAEKYGQRSGQKLHDTFNSLSTSLTERTAPKNAVKNIETVIKLLTEPVQIKRASDELKITNKK